MVAVVGLVLSTVAVAAPAVPAAAAPAGAESAAPVAASDPDPWPRVLESDKYTIKLYPPQVDAWDGSILEAHSAVAVLPKGTENPLYGVVEFRARTRVDREARLVTIDQFQSVNATFPSHPDKASKLLGFLQKKLNDSVRVIALDRLETAVAASGAVAAPAPLAVKNEAPRIVFKEGPTLLVSIDGNPVWRPIEGAGFERVLNTRPLLLRDTAGEVYLHLFDGWLTAPGLAGPWKPVTTLPAGLDAAKQKALDKQGADLLAGGNDQEPEVGEDGKPLPRPTLAKGPVPAIVVATEPTELIVFEAAPTWTAIAETNLEYVANTGGNVFRRGGATHFVLLAGRWFSAASLEGPWAFVPQGKLPAEFRKIPDDSPKENVMASVAGTPQAEEAVIANSVPQTSEVKRAEAKFEPRLDGEVKWSDVAGTSLQFAINSATPILRVDATHVYAVYDGVWFIAPVVKGPWSVAVDVPAVIYSIPPSSPLHYVTYVKVYNATKDVVVVGYTPGYYGTVVSDSVVVYGTGYAYSPWVGSSWYGAPATYGFGYGITYTPWNGWAFSIGVGWAWGYWGGWYNPYYAPYWGPYYGYYPYYGGIAYGAYGGAVAWGPGGWAGTTGNIYRQWGSVSSVSRYSGGYNAWTGNAWRGQVGASYNSRTGNLAAGSRGAVANVYSGQYAYGGRGVATDTRTGTTVAGGRVTMGNAQTGREITAGRVGGYNPNTGQGGSAAWARGEQGGVARVGDDYYAAKDGNVYRKGEGGWESVGSGGNWNGVGEGARPKDLDRQYSARSSGQQRYNSYRSTMPRSRPSGGGFRRR
jgi:hypothetical protein